MPDLRDLLQRSASHHKQLCPRQVLGVRLGLAGVAALGLEVPRSDKRLLAIAETDGCFVSGVEAATGCSVGGRTMRIEDYGKVAVTIVDTQTGRAVRLAPRTDVREKARARCPDEPRQYEAQLLAYQLMTDSELLTICEVRLVDSIEKIIGRPRVRAACDACGEEIINEREVVDGGRTLCRACAGTPYYSGAG